MDAEKTKQKYADGQVLSINYAPEGPVRVIWRTDANEGKGGQVVVRNEPDMEAELPAMSQKDLQFFYDFCAVSRELLNRQGRKMPVMFREIEQVVPKSEIKKLGRRELISIETLQVVDEDRTKRSHAFCWLTRKGLALRVRIETAADEFKKNAKADMDKTLEAINQHDNNPGQGVPVTPPIEVIP